MFLCVRQIPFATGNHSGKESSRFFWLLFFLGLVKSASSIVMVCFGNNSKCCTLIVRTPFLYFGSGESLLAVFIVYCWLGFGSRIDIYVYLPSSEPTDSTALYCFNINYLTRESLPVTENNRNSIIGIVKSMVAFNIYFYCFLLKCITLSLFGGIGKAEGFLQIKLD